MALLRPLASVTTPFESACSHAHGALNTPRELNPVMEFNADFGAFAPLKTLPKLLCSNVIISTDSIVPRIRVFI